MAKGSTFDNDFLKLIFQGTAIPNLADNAASSPITNLYVSLHTADPTAGNQSTNEVTYTGYARIGVARTSGGWTVSGNTVNPVSPVVFGTVTAGAGETITHVAIGTNVSGTGKILYVGAVSSPPTTTVGMTPTMPSTSTVTES